MAKLWNDADLPVYTPQNLTNRQAGLQAAQGKKQGSLLDSLTATLSGIAKSAGNVAKGVVGTIGGAATNNAITAGIDSLVNKKSFAQASQDARKREEEWQKSVYGGTGGKDTTNRLIGTNVDAGATLLDFIPGLGAGAKLAVNAGQGALSGFGQELAENGANADMNRAKQGALIGAASGLVGDLAGRGIGKLNPNGLLGKAAQSNLGRGALGGAAAGATGGGLAAAMNGGSLSDVLANAAQGAKGGAVGGATVAGLMGIGGSMLSRNKKGATNTAIEPEEATTVNKKRIAPTAETIAELPEATATRKGIAITDLDAGAQDINVRTNKATKSRGKYIDGVVKGENLPENKVTTAQRFAKEYDTKDTGKYTLADYIGSGNMGEDGDILKLLKDSITEDDYAKLKNAARESYDIQNYNTDTAYGNSKSALPSISLDDYKKVTGYGSKDIEPELRQFLTKDGRKLDDMAWAELFPGRANASGSGAVDITPDEILDYYRNVAGNDARRIYTTDNISYGLASEPELSNRIMEQVLDFYSPARKIDVQGGPATAQQLQVTTPTDLETTYIKRKLPAKQYEQAVATTTPQTIAKNAASELATVSPAEIATKPTSKTAKAAARKLRDIGNELQTSGTDITRAERKRLGIDNAGEVVNATRKRTGISDINEQAEFARNITGAGEESVMDTIQRAQMAKDRKVLTKDDYRNALSDTLDKNWSKSTMGNEKTKKQFFNDLIDDLDKQDPIDAANWLKDQAAAERAVSKGNSEGAPKAKMKAKMYTELANKMDDLTYSAVPKKNVDAMFDDTITEFRTRAEEANNAGNTKWAKAYDKLATELEGTPRTIEAYRTFKKDFVKSSQVADISAGARSGSLQAGIGRGFNIKNRIANTTLGPVVDKMLAGAGGVISDLADKLEGTKATSGAISGAANTIKNKAGNILGGSIGAPNNETLNNANFANQTANYGDVIANQIARQTGLKQAEFANNRRELANATEAYNQAANDYIAGQQLVAQERAQAQAMQNQSQLDRIGSAMDLALAAGDINAYNQLADLYKQAHDLDQLRNPQTSANLTAAQQAEVNKLDNAEKAINELEQLYTNAGGGKGLIGGNAANFAASLGLNSDVKTYNDLSQGLINQIMAATGKTDTLNTEGEVKRALSLIPQFTDTQETAQKKLEALRTMLQGTRETLATNYGLTQ